jgi:fructose/tagatose bisphosphate aldolase
MNGYAVPAICFYNLEGTIASCRAAEAKQSPVIIQLFPWAIEFANGLLVHAAAGSNLLPQHAQASGWRRLPGLAQLGSAQPRRVRRRVKFAGNVNS